MGATWSDVQKTIPELGTRRSEYTGKPGTGTLTDARADLEVLGYRTTGEFNFQVDDLYSVSFGPVSLPADSGEALFRQLNEFYSARFGAPTVNDGQDSPYFVKSRSWPTPWGEVGVLMSLEDGRRTVGWGYQRGLNTRRPS